MATYRKIIDNFFRDNQNSLESNYPGISPYVLYQQVSSYILGPEFSLDDSYVGFSNAMFEDFLMKVKQGIPLGHIVGRSYFYKSEFVVSSKVLIPRSETEILVDDAIQEIKRLQKVDNKKLCVVDIGTGSGAIILSIMMDCENLICYGVDISEDALKVATKNKFMLEYVISKTSSLEFLQGDRLCDFNQKIDVIVTNPPYIKEHADVAGVHQNVNKYEPKLALYLNDQTYDEWFIKLFDQSFEALNDGGVFLMEGHENHLKHLKLLAENSGFVNVSVIKDFTNRDRFLKAYK